MKLRIRPEADHEINSIINFYQARRSGLEIEFFDALSKEFKAIIQNTGRCGWIDDRFRKCRLRRFPYSIVYEPKKSVVEVIAVYHQARDPNYWRARLP